MVSVAGKIQMIVVIEAGEGPRIRP